MLKFFSLAKAPSLIKSTNRGLLLPTQGFTVVLGVANRMFQPTTIRYLRKTTINTQPLKALFVGS